MNDEIKTQTVTRYVIATRNRKRRAYYCKHTQSGLTEYLPFAEVFDSWEQAHTFGWTSGLSMTILSIVPINVSVKV